MWLPATCCSLSDCQRFNLELHRIAQLRGAKRKLDVGSGSAFDFDLNVKKKAGPAKGQAGEGKVAGAAESR